MMIPTSWTIPMLTTPAILPTPYPAPVPVMQNPQQALTYGAPLHPYYYPSRPMANTWVPVQQQQNYGPQQQAPLISTFQPGLPSTIIDQVTISNPKPVVNSLADNNPVKPQPMVVNGVKTPVASQDALIMAKAIEDIVQKYPQLKSLLTPEKLQQLRMTVSNPNQVINQSVTDILMNALGEPIKQELNNPSWFRRRAAKAALEQFDRFLGKASVIPGPTQSLFQDFQKKLQTLQEKKPASESKRS